MLRKEFMSDAKGWVWKKRLQQELNQVALTPENLAIIKQGFYQRWYTEPVMVLTTGKTIGEELPFQSVRRPGLQKHL